MFKGRTMQTKHSALAQTSLMNHYQNIQAYTGFARIRISKISQNKAGKCVHGGMLKDRIPLCVCVHKGFQTRNIHIKVLLYLQQNLPDMEPGLKA
jgi:hypothetical protein